MQTQKNWDIDYMKTWVQKRKPIFTNAFNKFLNGAKFVNEIVETVSKSDGMKRNMKNARKLYSFAYASATSLYEKATQKEEDDCGVFIVLWFLFLSGGIMIFADRVITYGASVWNVLITGLWYVILASPLVLLIYAVICNIILDNE